jgi:CRISPR-associated exonuclease Cas4
MAKSNTEKIIIYPSEIHHFAYCPRQYFFSLFIPVPQPLSARIRMLLGTIYHMIKGWISKRKGYRVEETLELDLGNVILRGRPDAYKSENGRVEVVERKSGKGPREGAWLSDALQAVAYALIIGRGEGEARLVVEYRTGPRASELDSEKVSLLIKIIDDIILVKKYGIVPYANRSLGRCAKCPYRDICEELDRVLAADDLYEPGSIVSELRVDKSFRREP